MGILSSSFHSIQNTISGIFYGLCDRNLPFIQETNNLYFQQTEDYGVQIGIAFCLEYNASKKDYSNNENEFIHVVILSKGHVFYSIQDRRCSLWDIEKERWINSSNSEHWNYDGLKFIVDEEYALSKKVSRNLEDVRVEISFVAFPSIFQFVKAKMSKKERDSYFFTLDSLEPVDYSIQLSARTK